MNVSAAGHPTTPVAAQPPAAPSKAVMLTVLAARPAIQQAAQAAAAMAQSFDAYL